MPQVGSALNLYIPIVRLVRWSPSICMKDPAVPASASFKSMRHPLPLPVHFCASLTQMAGWSVRFFSTPHTADTNFVFLDGLSIVLEGFKMSTEFHTLAPSQGAPSLTPCSRMTVLSFWVSHVPHPPQLGFCSILYICLPFSLYAKRKAEVAVLPKTYIAGTIPPCSQLPWSFRQCLCPAPVK